MTRIDIRSVRSGHNDDDDEYQDDAMCGVDVMSGHDDDDDDDDDENDDAEYRDDVIYDAGVMLRHDDDDDDDEHHNVATCDVDVDDDSEHDHDHRILATMRTTSTMIIPTVISTPPELDRTYGRSRKPGATRDPVPRLCPTVRRCEMIPLSLPRLFQWSGCPFVCQTCCTKRSRRSRVSPTSRSGT